jgi:hypothetical protein
MELRRHLAPAAIVTACLLPFDAFATSSWSASSSPAAIDYTFFGPAGANILTGHLSAVFANSGVQAGPFELLPYGIAHLIAVHTALGWNIFYSVFVAVLSFGIVFGLSFVRGTAPRTWSWYLALAVSAVAVLGWCVPSAVVLGHPAEVVIPVLWACAARCALEGRFAATGVLVALSAGWEVWGVLGAPVILLAVSPKVWRAALAGAVTLALLYLPFLLTGTFTMFGFAWTVSNDTLLAAIAPALHAFPWSLRLLQAAIAIGAGCLIAVLGRRVVYGVWLVPLAVILFRLLLDPVLLSYYWFAPTIVGIGMAADAVQRRQLIPLAFAAVVVGVCSVREAATFWGAGIVGLLSVAFVLVARRVDLGAILTRDRRGVLDRKDAETSPQ